MKLTLRTKIIGGLGLATALLLAVAVVSYRSTVHLTEEAASAGHAQKILTGLAAMLSTMTDAQTGARGYMLTGNAAFLDPYQQAMGRANAEFQALRRLTADEPRHQQRLNTLEPLLTADLAWLQKVIALRHTQGFAASQAATATGKGKQIHDAIRAAIREMEQEENRLLLEREQRIRTSARITLAVIVAGGLGMLLLVGTMLVIIHRGFAARQREEERFRRVFEAAPYGIVMVSAAGVIALVNAQTIWLAQWILFYIHAHARHE